MIETFRHRGLKRLYERDDASKLPPDMVQRIGIILAALDEANSLDDLNRPSFRLHQLKGDRHPHWSITVRANWRITFLFEEGTVRDVDFVDYH